MRDFRDYLNEKLKDEEFRRVYEEVSAEEDRKLAEADKDGTKGPGEPTRPAPAARMMGVRAKWMEWKK